MEHGGPWVARAFLFHSGFWKKLCRSKQKKGLLLDQTEMLSTCIPHILRQKGLAPTQRPALHTGGQARQVPQVLRQRLARDGEAVAVQEAPVQQVLLDCRGAPDALQVLWGGGGAGAGGVKYGGGKKEVTDPGAVSGGTPP